MYSAPEFPRSNTIRALAGSMFPPDEPGVLRGHFSSEVGGNIYSKATSKWHR